MSERESKICGYCGGEITPRHNLVICSGCNKAYHMHCWDKSGRCQTDGCEGKPVYHPAPEPEAQAPRQASSMAKDVPNYLAWAILATIFCCQPLGIVAIVFAAQASSSLAAGNYEAALKTSTMARNWCLAATVVGVVWIVLVSIAAFVLAFITEGIVMSI
ncbi:MAG: hypothetical protein GX890_01720 [Firmicutes bacterium]|jgi:hypothetical protein|nr:hypothetical protein [Bacillota bacterium]HPU02063.1 CD225/dispanin family protein [Bacillota bacterium]